MLNASLTWNSVSLNFRLPRTFYKPCRYIHKLHKTLISSNFKTTSKLESQDIGQRTSVDADELNHMCMLTSSTDTETTCKIIISMSLAIYLLCPLDVKNQNKYLYVYIVMITVCYRI